jgi:hypothetical protein
MGNSAMPKRCSIAPQMPFGKYCNGDNPSPARHGWRVAPRCAKIFGHAGLQIIIAIIAVAATGIFRMGMKIYRSDFAEINQFFTASPLSITTWAPCPRLKISESDIR